MKQIKLTVVFLAGFSLTGLNAQQAITTAGGNTTSSAGSVSYSVGQIVCKTQIGSSGSVAQGVQQPFEISVVLGLDEAQGINLVLSAYPNPATDYVILKVENFKTENLTYHLYDISGKLIESRKIISSTETIGMENLPSAIYFLKVTNNNTEVKTFKIIKN